ncbi:MAG: PepSY domain-containing protein [Gammaproteobacteria bacterium]|nr:PepSY domain-containing protein [Gammaproteobacteria bacterium]
MKTRMQVGTTLLAAMLGVSLLGAAGIGSASDSKDGKEKRETVRALLEAGEIRSLEQVLQRIREEGRGHVLEAELEREDGRYVYEVEVLDDQGKVRKYEYDARSGEAIDRR